MIDAALNTTDSYLALLACARRGLAGPVLVHGCSTGTHVHAMILSDDDEATENCLLGWVGLLDFERL